MRLPQGVVDPLFIGELALEMNMPVGELGQRMSTYELTVFWPLFFAARERERQREENKARGR